MKNASTKRIFLRLFGPGFITGASDDDPSGIATCAQAGAKFGYGQLWLMVFTYPLMMAVQEACARIGAVTGKGIAGIIGKRYNKKILIGVAALILSANVINIGADFAAMADAAHLILPLHPAFFSVVFAALILGLELFTTYRTYAGILKWLVLALLAYPITMFVVETPWIDVLRATILPHMRWDYEFLYLIAGMLGTTISPYMFIWEASEEVEEAIERKRTDGNGKTCMTDRVISNIRIDNATGMLSSQIVSWCIIVAAGTVLYKGGVAFTAAGSPLLLRHYGSRNDNRFSDQFGGNQFDSISHIFGRLQRNLRRAADLPDSENFDGRNNHGGIQGRHPVQSVDPDYARIHCCDRNRHAGIGSPLNYSVQTGPPAAGSSLCCSSNASSPLSLGFNS